MSARSRHTTASVKAVAPVRPTPVGAAGAATDEPLTELRARLQEVLDELEEQRGATDALKKSLAVAEQRVAAFESGEADRVRASLGDHDPGRYVAELEERRRERVALEERAHSEAARRLASTEKRLRTTEATLAQTLQALEEHRVTAVEQQMIAEATEHHATDLEQQMQARVQHAEALAAESKATLEEALRVSEDRRIAAAEMRTILDATEYRLSTLERERSELALERSAWDAERAALRADVEAAGLGVEQQRDELARQLNELRLQAEQLKAERASTTTALERTLAEVAMQREVAAGLGIERDAAIEQAKERERVAVERDRALSESRRQVDALEAASLATAKTLEQTTAELVTQRETAARAQQQWDETRATLTADVAAATAATAELQATHAALEQTVAERDRALTSARQDREQEGAARTALAQELEAVQARLAEQTRGTQALEAQANTLTHQLAEQRARAEQVQSELQSSVAQLEEQRRVSGVTAAEHHAVAQHLREVEEALGRRGHDLEELHATLARERDEWTAARSELLASLEREGGAQQELVAARQTLEEKLHAVETELHGERDRMGRVNEERAQVATALALVREELKEQLDAAAAVAEERGAELTAARGRLDATTAERNGLAATLEEERSARRQSETQHAQLEGEKRQLATQLTAGTAQIKALRHELDDAQTKGSQAAERVSRLEADLQGLQRQLQEAQARYTATGQEQVQRQQGLEKRLADTEAARVAAIEAARQAQAAHGDAQKGLQNELAQVRQQLQDRTAAVERGERALQEVGATAADLQRQLAELQKTREAAVSAQGQLTESLRAAGDQRSVLERRVAELEKARDVVVRDHAKATQALRAVTEQHATLEGQVAELQQTNAAVAKERERLTAALRVEGDQRSALERQVAELQKTSAVAAQEQERLTEAVRVAAAQQAALEGQRQTDGAERAQLQAEIGRLGEARTALQQRLQDTQTQLSAEQSAAQELRDLHAHGTELYQLVEAELHEARAANGAAGKQVEDLTAALGGRDRDLMRLQAALADAERRNRDEHARSEQLSGELSALARMRDELRSRVEALGDRDKIASRAAELERRLAESDKQGDGLRVQLTETQDQLHEAIQRAAAATAAAEEVDTVQAQLAEREAESERLRAQVENLSGQRDVLQRERDQLKRRAQEADDAERVREEQQRLLEKLGEVERQQGEATQRHSAAVSGYMVELNQRSELLRQRELQIERLTEELRVVQHACEDGISQVGELRQERDLLDLRVRELVSAAQAPRAAAAAKPAASDSLRLAPAETAGAETDKPAAAVKGSPKTPAAPPQAKPAPMAPAVKATPAPSPPAASTSLSAAAASTPKGLKPSRNASGVLNVVHLEDVPTLRDAVKASVGRFTRVKYTTAEDAPATVNPPTLLTINLLVKSIDPLVTLAHADAWGVQAPQAFAYCADGTRGSIIGLADFFPHPFDIEGCAARINDRAGGTQRLLVVGESVELLNQIRSTMNRIRCSTSVALDARQAFDLVSMVKPQVVLVDVGLPRAEGLRLIARLRTDPAYVGVGFGLMWTRELDANEFRTYVTRAVRDSPFSVDELGRSVSQTATALGFASEQLRDAG